MNDPFFSPYEVLSNARDHIHDFKAQIKTFWDAKPYTRVVEPDLQGTVDVHKIRITQPLPRQLARRAKDALSNLRDALDHAVYASAISLNPGRAPAKTNFPFAPTADGVRNKMDRELIGIPPIIRELLEDFRPYKGGNDTLWCLNDARNTKTHRLLVPLCMAGVANRTHLSSATIVGPMQVGYHHWDPTKNEVEYLRVGRGSQMHYEVNISFDVLFSDVPSLGALANQSAISSFDIIAAEVERIIKSIEAETTRSLNAKT